MDRTSDLRDTKEQIEDKSQVASLKWSVHLGLVNLVSNLV